MSMAPTVQQMDAEQVQRLRMAVGRLARRLRVSTAGELTASQLSSLSTVVKRGPLRIGELVALEAVNPTSLSRIVGRLEEGGLVRRTPDPQDGRGAVLEATPRGRRALEHVDRERTALLHAVVARLDPEHVTALRGALPALEALVEALPAAPRDGQREASREASRETPRL
jgi:DNA-binding MarR family transcriptional regulator